MIVLDCRFIYKDWNRHYILMEDERTLKNEYSERSYCTLEKLRLAEEQRREERERLGFKDCNLGYENIWG